MPPTNLVNLEDVGEDVRHPGPARRGLARRRATATASAWSAATAAARRPWSRSSLACSTPDPGRVTHTGGLRVGLLAQADVLDPTALVRQVVARRRTRPRVGRRPAQPRRRGLAARPGSRGTRPSHPLSGGERRRVALARAARRRPRPARPRRADQPPRRRGRGLAGRLPGAAPRRAGRRSRTTAGSSTRCAPGPGRSSTATCMPTTAATRRTCWRGPSASVARRPTRPAGRTCSARSWPGCVAGRRRGRPSRGSASTRRTPSSRTSRRARDSVEILRFASARLGRTVYDVEDATVVLGGRDLLRRHHLAARPRRPGRRGRRQRCRQEHAAAAARR